MRGSIEAVSFFSSRRRHTRCLSDWSSDVCSSDLLSNRVTDSLQICQQPHTSPLKRARRASSSRIAGFRAFDISYHRGIAANWKNNLRVVLVSTRNPLNIGAAARAMANFASARLCVVSPYDVAFREARSAVGAAPLLHKAEEFATLAEAVADCRLVVGTTSVGDRKSTRLNSSHLGISHAVF